jgi:hypothetical protein
MKGIAGLVKKLSFNLEDWSLNSSQASHFWNYVIVGILTPGDKSLLKNRMVGKPQIHFTLKICIPMVFRGRGHLQPPPHI